MRKVFISVVSHNNDDLIERNFLNLPTIYGSFEMRVMVIDNINSQGLKLLCYKNNLNYFSDEKTRGYGANNNKNFHLSNASDDDIFVVCNPDVTLQVSQLEELFNNIDKENADIYGVKVYENKDLSKFSSHHRMFPCLFDPLVSLIFKKKLFVKNANKYGYPDWIGGAFMAFKASSFDKLNGFDESYFMYYEDTDICHRAKNVGMKIVYNPMFYIVHDAQRAGRKIFSKPFFWNFSSMIKYFIKFPPKCFFSKNYGGK